MNVGEIDRGKVKNGVGRTETRWCVTRKGVIRKKGVAESIYPEGFG
jgi:hypothetical protein